MGLKAWNGVVLAAVASMWLASGTQREKPILTEEQAVRVRALESQVADSPSDAAAVRSLAQAYLDAGAPGLALVTIESSPTTVRREPVVEHLYARALLDQGRAVDALAAEQRVLDRCAPGIDGAFPTPQAGSPGSCDTWLLASATRRADILRQLVDLGVEDANAHPEASQVAYHNATREARLAVR
jgi:hypothetical protein